MKSNFPTSTQLLLDSGNYSDNPTPQGDLKTAALLEAMGALGYRAANVGLRDLHMGYQAFMERAGDVRFPLISTNVVRKDTREPVFEPYSILDVKLNSGRILKVGVLGAVRYNPVFLKAGPEGTNLVVERPEKMIARYLPEVRERSDLVILLAALHREDAKKIAAAVPGMDIILGSYGGAFSVRDEVVGDTWIYYSGNQGKRIGETRLFLKEDGDFEPPLAYMHHLTNRYPDNQEMLDYVNGLMVRLNDLKRDAAGSAAAGGSAAR